MDASNFSNSGLHSAPEGRTVKLLAVNSSSPTSQLLQSQLSKSVSFASTINRADWIGSDKMSYIRGKPSAPDNMTRWLQKAESESQLSQPIVGSSPQHIKQIGSQIGDAVLLPVRVESPVTGVSKSNTINIKNKFLQGSSQLALHLQKPTVSASNVTSDLPVNLTNVLLLSKSQLDNHSDMSLTGSSVTSAKPSVNYDVNPVYKSKLEKAVAQNQSVQSQLMMSTLMTKTPPKTLKKLLSTATLEASNSQQPYAQTSKKGINCNESDIEVSRVVSDDTSRSISHVPSSEETLKYVQSFAEEAARNIEEHERVIAAGLLDDIDDNGKYSEEVPQSGLNVDFDVQPCLPAQTDIGGTVTDLTCSSVNTPIPEVVQLTTAQDTTTTNPTMRVFCVGEKLVEMTPISGSLQALDCSAGNTMVPMIGTGVEYQSNHQAVAMTITEKDYEDPKLGTMLMEGMWKLREQDLFCDAILFVGQQEIKLHKLVLAAVSVEIYKKVESSEDSVIKLVLPADIKYENVLLFVSYIYTGKLKLTVDNVQHLYRLSAVFSIEELSKFCYDFCKLAKMGHLIIHSPYLEAAKQIRSTPSSANTTKIKEKIDAAHVTADAPSPRQPTASKQSTKKETKLPDIDWMNSDPSQCNIPIRKRGRTRKNLNTSSASESGLQYNIGNSSEASGKSDDFDASKNKTDAIQNTSVEIIVNTDARNDVSKALKLESKKTENTKSVLKELTEDVVVQKTVVLPDPLSTGKFDDSELLNLAPLINPEIPTGLETSPKVTPTKSMVTRFRGRPKNISALEAASNKKAKNNDIGASVSTRTAKPRGKSKRINTGFTMDPVMSEARDLTVDPYANLLETVDVQALHSGDFDKDESCIQRATSEESPKTRPESHSTKEKAESVKEPERTRNHSGGQVESMNEALDAEKNASDDKETTAVSLPKKARFSRKTNFDHPQDLPIKDTVYMRPPPKKRTKEIREMMKNEADTFKEEKSGLKFQQLMKYAESKFREIEDVENLNKGSKKLKGKKRKGKALEDAALTEKMYDIELSGQNLQGEKQYTCKLCSNEFVFVRRAITHLVGTHDIALEDANQYIIVENKTYQTSKVCDICGYRTKDCNTYYIHYHKYFKHNVPLPKGWQPYTCDLCKKEFFTKFQLREHKLIHFEDNPFVCEHCGSGYKSRTCLNSHVFHKHSSIKRHKCPECMKTFKTMTQMKVHQRTHTGEKPFGCPEEKCSYRSTTRGNLRLHLTNRHKLPLNIVKEYMAKVESTSTPESHVIWVGNAEPDVNPIAQEKDKDMEMDAEDRVLKTLVEAAAAEVSAQMSSESSSRQHAMNVEKFPNASSGGDVSIHVLAQEEGLMAAEQGNDYGLDQNTVHANDIGSAVINEQAIEGQNIPRHVELLIQNCGVETQDQLLHPYPHNTTQQAMENVSAVHELQQENATASSEYTEMESESIDLHLEQKPMILDPHSRKARMIINEALQGNSQGSMLKAVILEANMEAPKLHNLRTFSDGHFIPATQQYQGGSGIEPNQQHTSQSHGLLNHEGQIINSMRSPIQDQFGGGNSNSLYRLEPAASQSLNLSNSSQHPSSVDTSHLQSSFQVTTIAPPSYNSSTHGIISIPVSTIAPSHSTIAGGQVQGQGRQGQHTLQQSQQDYGISDPSVCTPTYSADGQHEYQGYYQDSYDIENY